MKCIVINKENIIKITIVVLIVLSIVGIFIFKNIEKSQIAKNSLSNTEVKKDTDVNIYSENLPMLLELGSVTCIPCKTMAPILEKISKDYKDKLVVSIVDVYKNSEQAQKYNIKVIPTQIFLDSESKIIYRHEGVLYEDEIIEKLIEMGIK
ncbi:MAG: thioredoxin family protein [Clostridia bacterium]|nr:thioredoxin family protein [Clostridia bacterium]MDD4387063.1 thioredoxin family protein [Clostridia bacterium]